MTQSSPSGVDGSYKYLIEQDGSIVGYFDELLDVATRHMQLGSTARIYKAITYKIEVTDLAQNTNSKERQSNE